MNFHLGHKQLLPVLLISLFCTLFFSTTRINFFIPFLIIAVYQRSLPFCLLCALGLGLIIDLLSSYNRFGITSCNYFLCTFILYPQKRHFFADRLSTLPLMTALFSTLSLSLHYLIQQAFEKPVPFAWEWLATDGLIMPLMDASTAFLVYTVPALLIGRRPKRGKDYFLS